MSAIDTMIANAAAAAQTQTQNQTPVTIDQQTQTVQTTQVVETVDAEEQALLAQMAELKAKKAAQAQLAQNAPQNNQPVNQIQPQYVPAGTQVAHQAGPAQTAVATAVGVAALPAHLAAALAAPIDMSMDTFMSMGMAVDLWLKPSFAGLTIGENATPVPHIDVVIDMTEKLGFTLIMAIRFGKEPNVKYDYTTDYVTNKDGRPWADALALAYSMDPAVSPYRAAQIPMVAVEDTKNFKGEVVALAGQTLGYTTAVTGWSSWQNFYLQVQRAGLLNHKVKVRLTNEAKVKDVNKWGLVKFELLGAADVSATAQKTA